MIVYSLRCKNGHEFEGWFRDSASYDVQSEEGKLSCPTCNSRRVEKAIMAPAVAASDRKPELSNPETRKMRQFMTGLRKYVQEMPICRAKFAEEARKIHYGSRWSDTSMARPPGRSARLAEEGVDVAPARPISAGANWVHLVFPAGIVCRSRNVGGECGDLSPKIRELCKS